ncbi:glycoside hydrolase superfamily [Microdochium bolleyi]|uniref:chitinase n=1 Tax=Microdochium bolleyi TaxID=196109 RepID=A0A136IPT6_9PEZI|nr:glycoside hydrolase superfamily [Microdochium bolleyi]
MSTSSARRRKASVAGIGYTNAVYFPSSKIYQGATPGMMNYKCINHVYYAFASVAADGTVYLGDEWADTQAPCDGVHGGIGSLMHLKQANPHLSVVISVGGGTSSTVFPVVAASPLLRDNFARSARGLVEASGFDGIDIMWEFPADMHEGADFVDLLSAVRVHMPEDQFLVTAGLPCGVPILENIDIATASVYVDYINLMAYDFSGPWDSRSGHHAQLYTMDKASTSADTGVSYLVGHGCPSQKILLGIPLYGRSFLGVNGPGHRHKGCGGDNGAFEYNMLPRRNAKEVVDKRACAASCAGGDGGWVTYDNPDTVKMKGSYCKQKKLGGLFYWSGPADSTDRHRSLIAAGFKALHSS